MTSREWYEQEIKKFESLGIKVGARSWYNNNDNDASVFSYKSTQGTMGHPQYESHFRNGKESWNNLPA